MRFGERVVRTPWHFIISRPTYQGSDWWKFSIWNGWWGANQSASSSVNLAGNLSENSVVNVAGNLVGNVAGQGGGDKAYLRKAVIGGNLAFGIGWWGTN